MIKMSGNARRLAGDRAVLARRDQHQHHAAVLARILLGRSRRRTSARSRPASTRGQTIDRLASVASLFVSRVDTEIDERIEAKGGPLMDLRGKIAVANAQLAYA